MKYFQQQNILHNISVFPKDNESTGVKHMMQYKIHTKEYYYKTTKRPISRGALSQVSLFNKKSRESDLI